LKGVLVGAGLISLFLTVKQFWSFNAKGSLDMFVFDIVEARLGFVADKLVVRAGSSKSVLLRKGEQLFAGAVVARVRVDLFTICHGYRHFILN
jgi:hypothetical protein